MNDWQWVAVTLVVAFFIYGGYHDYYLKPKREARWAAEAEERRTSEQYVIEQQLNFEKRLHDGIEIGLPDAIERRAAYIYLHLMRQWFNELAAQSRYDEAKVKKVRKDWLIYMEALNARETSRYLAHEVSDDAKRAGYEKDSAQEHRQVVAIEDAFAQAVGPDAVERLRDIRSRDFNSFSRAGELAPDGYRFGISLPGKPQPLVPRTSVD